MTPVSPAQWKGRARWQRQKEPDSRVWKSQWEALAHEVIISGVLALKDRKGIGPGRKEDGWFSTQDGRNKRVKCRWGRGSVYFFPQIFSCFRSESKSISSHSISVRRNA